MKTTRHQEREVTHRLYPSIKGWRSPGLEAAAAMLIAVGAAGLSAPSSAQVITATELSLAEIERVFWVCDHATTIGRIDGSGTALPRPE